MKIGAREYLVHQASDSAGDALLQLEAKIAGFSVGSEKLTPGQALQLALELAAAADIAHGGNGRVRIVRVL